MAVASNAGEGLPQQLLDDEGGGRGGVDAASGGALDAGREVGQAADGLERNLVWRLWTEPEHVARWWGPHGFRTTIRELEVRPGGAWRFVMHGPDATDYDNEMVCAEVCRPAHLVYKPTVPPVFRQEVAFTNLGDGRTRVAVRSTFDRPEDVQP